MTKSFIVDSTYNNMRLDRFLRNKLGKIPQSLIEKILRIGKIKINKRKAKCSFKVKTNDKIDIFNFKFECVVTSPGQKNWNWPTLETHNFQFGQIHFEIWTNTFCNSDKYFQLVF